MTLKTSIRVIQVTNAYTNKITLWRVGKHEEEMTKPFKPALATEMGVNIIRHTKDFHTTTFEYPALKFRMELSAEGVVLESHYTDAVKLTVVQAMDLALLLIRYGGR